MIRGWFLFVAMSFLISCSGDDTANPADTESPSEPTNLQATDIDQTTVTLSWNASIDNTGVTGYQIFLDGSLITNVSATTTLIPNLSPNTNYSFFVRASDAAGNISPSSNTVNITTLNACSFPNEIFPSQTGQQLLQSLKGCYTPSTIYSYADARDHLYTSVDLWDDGLVHTVYTDYTIAITGTGLPRQEALAKGINTEHLFPQSMGADSDPARSDLFHIFPARDEVNGYRSNKPFGDIDDVTTDRWYYRDQLITGSIPTTGIDNYSEGTSTEWEPRENIKGDVARAVFYFYTIYNNVANQTFFNSMKDDLLVWHTQDPVDAREEQRNDKIQMLQGNNNPFVLDVTLAGRVFN